ncbi:hypothetical protein RB195_017246 [Necator americanus]|uniref:Uncharacterized protein n=1 Tax=Necator americanus TaxID=51031 RepID=A0ABR1C5D5_NECAM
MVLWSGQNDMKFAAVGEHLVLYVTSVPCFPFIFVDNKKTIGTFLHDNLNSPHLDPSYCCCCLLAEASTITSEKIRNQREALLKCGSSVYNVLDLNYGESFEEFGRYLQVYLKFSDEAHLCFFAIPQN